MSNLRHKLMMAALVAALSLMSVPAWAASTFSFSGLSGAEYDTAGVFVLGDYTYTATTNDGGGFDQVQFQLYDDGILKFQQTSFLTVGLTGTFHFEVFYPGLVGTSAPGVGLLLNDLPGGGVLSIDPFLVPHYSDPSQCTHDCGPVSTPEPSTLLLLGAGLCGVGFMKFRKPVQN